MEATVERVRVRSTSIPGRHSKDGEHSGRIEIDNFTAEEVEKMKSLVNAGFFWMTVRNGRPVFVPTMKSLPGPVDDKEMMPFWRLPKEGEVETKEMVFDEKRSHGEFMCASILIQSLCGYDYSPGNYLRESGKLYDWGFDCLRSRRGDDGRFSEIWFLPSLWSAERGLKKTLGDSKPDSHEALSKAIAFIAARVSFGTLDTVVQRLAAVID